MLYGEDVTDTEEPRMENFEGKCISKAVKQLGLVEYYPGKITIELARSKFRKRVVKVEDIPWVYLENVLNPEYDGRNIFFTGKSFFHFSICMFFHSKQIHLKEKQLTSLELLVNLKDCLKRSTKEMPIIASYFRKRQNYKIFSRCAILRHN